MFLWDKQKLEQRLGWEKVILSPWWSKMQWSVFNVIQKKSRVVLLYKMPKKQKKQAWFSKILFHLR